MELLLTVHKKQSRVFTIQEKNTLICLELEDPEEEDQYVLDTPIKKVLFDKVEILSISTIFQEISPLFL